MDWPLPAGSARNIPKEASRFFHRGGLSKNPAAVYSNAPPCNKNFPAAASAAVQLSAIVTGNQMSRPNRRLDQLAGPIWQRSPAALLVEASDRLAWELFL